MMSNFNINYINDVPPAQEYEEFGDETNETLPVPSEYAPTVYNVQYTGVSSFEFNGTTYYNYYVYDVPVLSLYNYSGFDYPIEVNADANVVTEDACDYSDVVTEDGCDYSVGVIADSYNSHVITGEGSDNNDYKQSSFYGDSVSSNLSITSSVSVNYDSAYSDSFSTGISYDNSLNNAGTGDDNNYPETTITSTEKISSYVNFPSPKDSLVINNENNVCPNTQVDNNFADLRNEGTYLENVAEYDINASGIDTETVSKNCDESNVLEHLVDARVESLYEDSEEQLFVYEENTVLDWTTEVKDNDVKDEDDDYFKMIFSTSNDMDTYNSTEVIKYLKDSLYLYALSGHMSLKESLPVVDILPTIDEESEFEEEDDSLEHAVDNLEHNEEKVLSDAEKNEFADLLFDRSLPIIECHALECTVENSEQVTKDISGLAEKNLSSVPTAYKSEQNLRNREYHAAQRGEMVKNDHNIPMNDTKFICFTEDCTSLESGEELQISVENVSNPVERDNVFNATLKFPPMHNHEKRNLSKPQNDCIKIVEEIGATEIKALCSKNDTELNHSEEVVIKKDLILDQDYSNPVTNTACYVPREKEPHSECYSEKNIRKTIQAKEKVPSKSKKKKFHSLRKWFGNMCCCARKKS